jgi:hypothetical protein
MKILFTSCNEFHLDLSASNTGFRRVVTNLFKTEGKQLNTYLCSEFLSHFRIQWQKSVMLACIQEV